MSCALEDIRCGGRVKRGFVETSDSELGLPVFEFDAQRPATD
jgi:hypothetical protein